MKNETNLTEETIEKFKFCDDEIGTFICSDCTCSFPMPTDTTISEYAFCPYCGKPIVNVYHAPEDDNEYDEEEAEYKQYLDDIASAWNEAKGFC